MSVSGRVKFPPTWFHPTSSQHGGFSRWWIHLRGDATQEGLWGAGGGTQSGTRGVLHQRCGASTQGRVGCCYGDVGYKVGTKKPGFKWGVITPHKWVYLVFLFVFKGSVVPPPETNSSSPPRNRPKPKKERRGTSSNHPFFRGYVSLVSWWSHKTRFKWGEITHSANG